MAADGKNIREGYTRLAEIARRLKSGKEIEPVTVRELLRWFGAEQRGDRIHFEIAGVLRFVNLRTEPWFQDQFTDGAVEFYEGYWGGSHVPTESEKMTIDLAEQHFKEREEVPEEFRKNVWVRLINRRLEAWANQLPAGWLTQPRLQTKIDELAQSHFSEEEILEEIYFTYWPEAQPQEAEPQEAVKKPEPQHLKTPPEVPGVGVVIDGPWPRPSPVRQRVPEAPFRIRRLLQSAKGPLVYVSRDDTISEAITKMSLNDFSQLPVMRNDRDRDVKGIVSWRSIVGRMNRPPEIGMQGQVHEYMDPEISEIDADKLLLDGIAQIQMYEYALVRERDNRKIIGIVTATDLSGELKLLSEPFLLLRQIENRIRRLISDTFSRQQLIEWLAAVWGEVMLDRNVTDVFDLEFGDYQRLLQNKEFWDRLNVRGDRGTVVKTLGEIRDIRNRVMHFDPDGIGDRLNTLRNFTKLLLESALMQRAGMTPFKNAC
jgi:predicted transcriptional regulator